MTDLGSDPDDRDPCWSSVVVVGMRQPFFCSRQLRESWKSGILPPDNLILGPVR
jgi:hypothetical protein